MCCWIYLGVHIASQRAKFMGTTWDPFGSCQPQMGPMLAPRTLLSGVFVKHSMEQSANRYVTHRRLCVLDNDLPSYPSVLWTYLTILPLSCYDNFMQVLKYVLCVCCVSRFLFASGYKYHVEDNVLLKILQNHSNICMINLLNENGMCCCSLKQN